MCLLISAEPPLFCRSVHGNGEGKKAYENSRGDYAEGVSWCSEPWLWRNVRFYSSPCGSEYPWVQQLMKARVAPEEGGPKYKVRKPSDLGSRYAKLKSSTGY